MLDSLFVEQFNYYYRAIFFGLDECRPPGPGQDLPANLKVNPGSFRGPQLAGDVVCLTKRYISDSTLSQDPLLVLPETRVDRVSMVPTVKLL